MRAGGFSSPTLHSRGTAGAQSAGGDGERGGEEEPQHARPRRGGKVGQFRGKRLIRGKEHGEREAKGQKRWDGAAAHHQ